MFIMFENFIIYLNILLCTCAPLPNKNEVSTTIDLEHEVQMEIAPILKKLENVLNTVDNNTRLYLKGEFVGELMSLNDSLHKLKTLTIPLVFRNYANKIEDKFPNKAIVPQNVMSEQTLHMGILQRKYHWIDILSKNENSNDAHVKLIKQALKEKFFSEENIPVEKEIQDLAEDQQKKYYKFLEDFCEGIAASVDYVNKIVAHNNFGRYPGNDLLNVFKKAYNNKYVSLFYYAVVDPLEE